MIKSFCRDDNFFSCRCKDTKSLEKNYSYTERINSNGVRMYSFSDRIYSHVVRINCFAEKKNFIRAQNSFLSTKLAFLHAKA